jgi:hypothetical protein
MRSSLYQVAPTPVAPQADADLDIRTLRTWQAVDDDGDPVMVIKDDETAVVIDVGDGGSWDAAIRAAERLSDMALSYASRLRALQAHRRVQAESGGGQS